MNIELRLTGRTPLLMHNIRLADPDDPIVEAIRKITSKRSKQTSADRAEVSRLEWRGALYTAVDQHGTEFVTKTSGGGPGLQAGEESGPRKGWPGEAGTAQSAKRS